jgi:hypothetical protein
VDGGGVGVVRSGGFPPLSTPREIGPDLGFLFLATVILGMCASYRHMEAGAHYPEDWGRPDQGVKKGASQTRSWTGPS